MSLRVSSTTALLIIITRLLLPASQKRSRVTSSTGHHHPGRPETIPLLSATPIGIDRRNTDQNHNCPRTGIMPPMMNRWWHHFFLRPEPPNGPCRAFHRRRCFDSDGLRTIHAGLSMPKRKIPTLIGCGFQRKPFPLLLLLHFSPFQGLVEPHLRPETGKNN